jgi:hypothetical protein
MAGDDNRDSKAAKLRQKLEHPLSRIHEPELVLNVDDVRLRVAKELDETSIELSVSIPTPVERKPALYRYLRDSLKLLCCTFDRDVGTTLKDRQSKLIRVRGDAALNTPSRYEGHLHRIRLNQCVA